MIAVSARRLFECRPNAPCKSRPYVSALAFFHLGRAARRALCYALDMERLRFFVLVAAILTFAITVPISAIRAVQCPCDASAPCHCPLVGCQLLPAPSSSCHCALAALPAATGFVHFALIGSSAWRAPAPVDLYGLEPIPPLRPPIPETTFAA